MAGGPLSACNERTYSRYDRYIVEVEVEAPGLLVTIVSGSTAALRVRVWRELRKLGAVYLH